MLIFFCNYGTFVKTETEILEFPLMKICGDKLWFSLSEKVFI